MEKIGSQLSRKTVSYRCDVKSSLPCPFSGLERGRSLFVEVILLENHPFPAGRATKESTNTHTHTYVGILLPHVLLRWGNRRSGPNPLIWSHPFEGKEVLVWQGYLPKHVRAIPRPTCTYCAIIRWLLTRSRHMGCPLHF